ncbi:MAG: YebC/PmpR family DNA-binding transcriptional regulator [Chloroflexi bacterium]|nr:YebC/PmpR family DNA-binding transcriptional regulator [Chloroflexota bacterium]
MSGHSKWSTIKHKKAVTDQRRGALFTKLAREIIVAAREGGPDPEMNFRLRLATNNARASNMPNDNIDRAIKKGAGVASGDEQLHEVVYEGYAPGGAAILVQALTDNRNRTASEVRSRFTKAGGNLAESGAVSWGFDMKGAVRVTVDGMNPDDLALEAVDAGAEDFTIDGNAVEFTAARNDLAKLRSFLEGKSGVKIETAEFAMIPKTTVQLDPAKAQQALRLLDSLEELDDVQKVYTNADFPDEVLAAASR